MIEFLKLFSAFEQVAVIFLIGLLALFIQYKIVTWKPKVHYPPKRRDLQRALIKEWRGRAKGK